MAEQQEHEGSKRGAVTRVLISLRDRGPDAWEELVPLVYDELRAIAHNQLRVESRRDRLETTALVHEAFLRLVDQTRVEWRDRTHFFAVAAMVMRRVLINEAHRRKAEKRGGGRPPVSLDGVEVPVMPGERAEELIALDAAITRLEEMNGRQGRVVELRYFGGLSVEETAAALSVSTATVKRDWRLARAWLYRELEGSAS